MIVETLVFDLSQVTSRQNYSHPKWGGCCHPITTEAARAIVIIKDAEGNRNIEPRSASGKL